MHVHACILCRVSLHHVVHAHMQAPGQTCEHARMCVRAQALEQSQDPTNTMACITNEAQAPDETADCNLIKVGHNVMAFPWSMPIRKGLYESEMAYEVVSLRMTRM